MNAFRAKLDASPVQNVVWLAGKAAADAVDLSVNRLPCLNECRLIINSAIGFDEESFRTSRRIPKVPKALLSAVRTVNVGAKKVRDKIGSNYYSTGKTSLRNRLVHNTLLCVESCGNSTGFAWERNDNGCRENAINAIRHSCEAISTQIRSICTESINDESIGRIGLVVLATIEAVRKTALQTSTDKEEFFKTPLIRELITQNGGVLVASKEPKNQELRVKLSKYEQQERLAKLREATSSRESSGIHPVAISPSPKIPGVLDVIGPKPVFDLTGFLANRCIGSSVDLPGLMSIERNVEENGARSIESYRDEFLRFAVDYLSERVK